MLRQLTLKLRRTWSGGERPSRDGLDAAAFDVLLPTPDAMNKAATDLASTSTNAERANDTNDLYTPGERIRSAYVASPILTIKYALLVEQRHEAGERRLGRNLGGARPEHPRAAVPAPGSAGCLARGRRRPPSCSRSRTMCDGAVAARVAASFRRM